MITRSRPHSKANPGWFAKGRSGNPKGRPSSSRASKGSAFEVLVEKTLTVDDKGGTREITVEEALQHRTYQDALAGKRMAVREVVKWIIKREAWLEKNAVKRSPPAITHDIAHDPDNADAALLLLGIAAHNAERAELGKDRAQLLLEPWAVQAALRRRRGGQRLSDQERSEIRRCMRDADGLRWQWDWRMTLPDGPPDDTEDDSVGYRQPPRKTRFTKGRSGNPAGRPRNRHREIPYQAVLGRMVTIREGGATRRVTAAEAFLLQLAKRGVEGDSAAARASLAVIEEAMNRQGAVGPLHIVWKGVAPGSVTTALEALRMARILDPYRKTARVVLEPWLVEAALARLPQTLNPADQRTIVEATRTPHKVRWPDWWSENP